MNELRRLGNATKKKNDVNNTKIVMFLYVPSDN